MLSLLQMNKTQKRLKLNLNEFESFIKKYEIENMKEIYKPFNSKLFNIYKNRLIFSQNNNIPFNKLPNINKKYSIKNL